MTFRSGCSICRAMNSAFFFLVVIAALATLGVLATGIVSMLRGGEFNRRHGNRLMRLRVLLQAIAIGLIGLILLFGGD